MKFTAGRWWSIRPGPRAYQLAGLVGLGHVGVELLLGVARDHGARHASRSRSSLALFFLAGIDRKLASGRRWRLRFLSVAGWLACREIASLVTYSIAWGARRGFYRRSDACVGVPVGRDDVIALAGVLADGRPVAGGGAKSVWKKLQKKKNHTSAWESFLLNSFKNIVLHQPQIKPYMLKRV